PPVRLILDPQRRLPATFNVFDCSTPTYIFTEKTNCLSKKNCEFIYFDFSNKNITHLINAIYDLNIHSILVEGGAKLLASFIAAGLWNEAQIEISPATIGDGVTAPLLPAIPVGEKIYERNRILYYKK
ncbi:MAG: dihydrofolate reductase family protein, partial [Prevotellaceae bacterium]|nr:dihydrofolate reductase family protein [Prevotellaceae bacterium]